MKRMWPGENEGQELLSVEDAVLKDSLHAELDLLVPRSRSPLMGSPPF